MELHFLVTADEFSGGLVATAIGETITTQADNEEELKHMIRDAVLCHYEDGQAPAVIRLHYSREETLSLV